jgi:hypothetical protein
LNLLVGATGPSIKLVFDFLWRCTQHPLPSVSLAVSLSARPDCVTTLCP